LQELIETAAGVVGSNGESARHPPA
jgi:hypothetical protein